jgi:hypothetical protein
MKILPSLFLVIWFSTFVTTVTIAAEQRGFYGRADCRVAALEPVPAAGEVKWNGQCMDGFAHGQGVLEWTAVGHGRRKLEATLTHGEVTGEGTLTNEEGVYIGTFKNGLPHGQGYFKYANGKGQYEGGVANGSRQGKGIFINVDRSRYEGEWKDGVKDGYGRETFALGGSYEGEWKAGKFDGKGKIVYAGDGRTYEGQFSEGRVTGTPVVEIAKLQPYALKKPVPTGSMLAGSSATGYLPLTRSWEELSPAQQNLQRSFYPALEEGNVPPYPLHGPHDLYDAIVKIRDAQFHDVSGDLLLYVTIGVDGRPKTVAAIGLPDQNMTKYIAMAVMTQEFKPAFCHGKPCEMVYPLSLSVAPWIQTGPLNSLAVSR